MTLSAPRSLQALNIHAESMINLIKSQLAGNKLDSITMKADARFPSLPPS